MHYTLHQLQIFLTVAQTQSVTKAAETLHLTQPAISIQLKNFQDQFEIPLAEVVGRKIYITDFGKEIAHAAENILAQVDDINNKTLAYKGQLTGKLKLSVVSTGKYVMPYFLSGFMDQHVGVELSMDVTNKTRIIESLEKNEVDFCLVSILPQHIAVNKIDLLENTLHLVGDRRTKIKKQSGKHFIEDLPLIFRENGSGTRQVMEQFINKHKLSIRKKMELTSNEAVKQAVLAGLGYSIMPSIGIKNELNNGDIKIIPVNGLPIKTMWRLIWLKGKKLSPAASAFSTYLNQEKSNIIKKYFSELKL
jgi:LysR family transcriptional regulator, low CO2-responsive transcriptional regulator